MQAGRLVEVAGREAEVGGFERGVGLAQHVTEGIVGDVIDDAGRVGQVVVLDPVVDRVQVIGQGPIDVA